jgi:hypothetical protein
MNSVLFQFIVFAGNRDCDVVDTVFYATVLQTYCERAAVTIKS